MKIVPTVDCRLRTIVWKILPTAHCRLVTMAACFLLPALLSAQDWVEYVNRVDRFTVSLPAQPAVHDTTYRSQRGATLPARVYSVQHGRERYAVTVVDFATDDDLTDVRGSIAWAAWDIRKRGGEITYDAFAQVDRIEGHELHVTNADRSITFAAIYLHARRLYILDATVPAGAPPPLAFQQSLQILDEDGRRIRYALDAEGNRAKRVR